ncbi:NADH:ubiquinone reductase (Na(+)-transporting) subunit C [Porphyromonadaceae bacterium W3.11]|nr:NADH:ubiquinone reductase (Na(+)-transporting) subunit C [Porphyromonadaceae bacterium W3.11]
MNKNSNTYVILYSVVMVVIVAIGLAFTSELLKDRQKSNANIDTMRQILSSLHITTDESNTESVYANTIQEAFVVDAEGNVIPGSEGVTVNDQAFTTRLQDLYSAPKYPVFVAEIDGEKKYVLGMYGAGLWGPIWGYLAMDADADTVYGTTMSHEGETPGLGAEITSDKFLKQFPGKHIFVEGEFKSIAVVKPGKSVSGKDYVDGISGGTLTSQGVDQMLYNSLKLYEPYLNKLKK